MTIQNTLNVVVCKDANEAMQNEFVYREPVYKSIKIDKVVVVENGTQLGKSTVDLIMEDGNGQKFVVMVTGALLKSIPC